MAGDVLERARVARSHGVIRGEEADLHPEVPGTPLQCGAMINCNFHFRFSLSE